MDWGVLIGIAGILVAIYTYIRTRSIKSLVYDTHTILAVDLKKWATPFADVSLCYRADQIDRLSRSYFLIWNAGNNTIEFNAYLNDLAVLVDDGASIFGGGVIKSDDDANGAAVIVGENGRSAKLRFDYLRARDGIIFFINHSSQRDKLSFKFLDKEKNLTRTARIDKWWAFAYPLTVVIVYIPIVALTFYFRDFFPEDSGGLIPRSILLALIACAGLLSMLIMNGLNRLVPRISGRYFLFHYGSTALRFYAEIKGTLTDFYVTDADR